MRLTTPKKLSRWAYLETGVHRILGPLAVSASSGLATLVLALASFKTLELLVVILDKQMTNCKLRELLAGRNHQKQGFWSLDWAAELMLEQNPNAHSATGHFEFSTLAFALALPLPLPFAWATSAIAFFVAWIVEVNRRRQLWMLLSA